MFVWNISWHVAISIVIFYISLFHCNVNLNTLRIWEKFYSPERRKEYSFAKSLEWYSFYFSFLFFPKKKFAPISFEDLRDPRWESYSQYVNSSGLQVSIEKIFSLFPPLNSQLSLKAPTLFLRQRIWFTLSFPSNLSVHDHLRLSVLQPTTSSEKTAYREYPALSGVKRHSCFEWENSLLRLSRLRSFQNRSNFEYLSIFCPLEFEPFRL